MTGAYVDRALVSPARARANKTKPKAATLHNANGKPTFGDICKVAAPIAGATMPPAV